MYYGMCVWDEVIVGLVGDVRGRDAFKRGARVLLVSVISIIFVVENSLGLTAQGIVNKISFGKSMMLMMFYCC